MRLEFSFIIPVYNRPQEIAELLQSFTALETPKDFEIIIVEDGSTITAKSVIKQFEKELSISYYFKENSGPGSSRNFGMQKAKGNYFIILDSDCILPKHYLNEVVNSLEADFVHCFGGPDAAHQSFTNLQKAINFSMTSFITTGGIRGSKQSVNTFQPRSFNMGISKEAFIKTNGFGNIHPGEDPDLSIRLWELGYKTKLIPNAYVFHKRRISWSKFYKQVSKFGKVRPILNYWHPHTQKITYWFPSVFCIGFIISIILLAFNFSYLIWLYVLYFALAFVLALISSKNLMVALQSLLAIVIQFVGYGFGFIKSTFAIKVLHKNPETYFPELFFKK